MDNQARQEAKAVEVEIVVPQDGASSVALERLIEEVRVGTPANPALYNRTYHRHNR